jgi:aspartokinase/homoserine dehydrogenase 1
VGGLRRRVLKFGGTSVGSPPPLRMALSIVRTAAAEAPVLVVVSALAGVTDALEAALAGAAVGRLDATAFAAALRERHLALLGAVARGGPAVRVASLVGERSREIERRLRGAAAAESATPAERAALLALGERLSAPLVAGGLRALGLRAEVLDAVHLIRTDDRFDEASVDLDATRQLVRAGLGPLPAGVVPVVTGFVGGTGRGETTLLGRGGSDYSAGVLGGALDAERVEIWSDVPGVMSADPRVAKDARTLPRLSYAEAAALARAGAKVLHPRTLEPLEGAGIPVFVGRTLDPAGPGTWIGPVARDADGAAA